MTTIRPADPDRRPLPRVVAHRRAGFMADARPATVPPLRRSLTRKPRAVPGWRVDRGATTSRVTDHGGRAHTVHSFATRGASLGGSGAISEIIFTDRTARRRRIRATRGRVTA